MKVKATQIEARPYSLDISTIITSFKEISSDAKALTIFVYV